MTVYAICDDCGCDIPSHDCDDALAEKAAEQEDDDA